MIIDQDEKLVKCPTSKGNQVKLGGAWANIVPEITVHYDANCKRAYNISYAMSNAFASRVRPRGRRRARISTKVSLLGMVRSSTKGTRLRRVMIYTKGSRLRNKGN